ncbi:tetratricopeptide repeat protein [Prevotella sp. E2-28]|uniref:tetratricopeptide repeat protein n=1 Tax=Prevotella sp. E2-28 TaxID=2913620 RepID=UPI001EDC42F7|nr:tetratricopeptide repeat protein [Prevotella sp. E2-28]UKK52762.1 tetratricopeptide repeat protein [Prevotella sp. E2-28]
MRHSRYYIIFLLLTVMSVSSYADNRQARKLIRKGNALYRTEKRQEAQVNYLKAYRADSTDARVLYNLSTSMFPADYKLVQKERCDTMAQMFERSARAETNPLRKAQAYHNEGVAYQGVKDFGKAIEAYKNALRNNPNDDESRYNLVLCQRQLKNQNGGNNNQQQNQDQQDQNQQQQQKEQEKKQQEQQDKQQEQQEPPMSKENAEQLLNAAMQQEKETQKRMKENLQQTRRRRIEKNW